MMARGSSIRGGSSITGSSEEKAPTVWWWFTAQFGQVCASGTPDFTQINLSASTPTSERTESKLPTSAS
ncbi:MAG: hypothetical protein RDU20_13960 [Desulfomonilaceae bacterium]|nr:hypothetical protein [Desulfomonilaceae bacterium]